MASVGWNVDPEGRHQERYFDGRNWTAQVRDHGVENIDPVGATTVAAPAAPVVPMIERASVYDAPPASATTPVPVVGPPPSMTSAVPIAHVTYAGAPEASFVATPASRRRGIPAMLAIAVVLAAFPAVLVMSFGGVAVMAGSDISNNSSTFDSSYGFDSSSSSSSLSSDIDSLGDASGEVGAVLLVVGALALLFVVLAAGGSNAGRVITALWLAGVAIYLLSQVGDMPSDGQKYAAMVIAPPVLALIGLFTPSSNEVFRNE